MPHVLHVYSRVLSRTYVLGEKGLFGGLACPHLVVGFVAFGGEASPKQIESCTGSMGSTCNRAYSACWVMS